MGDSGVQLHTLTECWLGWALWVGCKRPTCGLAGLKQQLVQSVPVYMRVCTCTCGYQAHVEMQKVRPGRRPQPLHESPGARGYDAGTALAAVRTVRT